MPNPIKFTLDGREVEAVDGETICGLGQAAPNPVNHLLTYFREDM
jgi:NADH:ubiquinone oxidoreductase subunit F (NADH-binding)